MKTDKSVCKMYLQILDKLKLIEHRRNKGTDLTFRPIDANEENCLIELSKQDKPPIIITLVTMTSLHDFESLVEVAVRSVEPPFVNRIKNIYKVSIIPQRFNELKNEYENTLNSSQKLEIKDCFGFENTRFWLKRVAGETLIVDFKPQNNSQVTNAFCFMNALIESIRSNGHYSDDWITTIISEEKMSALIKSIFPEIEPDNVWRKNAKGALIKKLHGLEDYIFIPAFNKSNNSYGISLKIPEFLLV